MPQPILVTGATGTVGEHVIHLLLAAGHSVRAAARDVQSMPVEPNLVAVPFDFTDPTTWQPAFDGISVMFLLRPPALSRVKRDLLPALSSAQEAGMRHVVFLSLQGADRNPVVPHAAIERWLRRSAMTWTFVRPSFFMQNLSTTHSRDIRDHHEIVVPAGGGRTSFVDAAVTGREPLSFDVFARRERAAWITDLDRRPRGTGPLV